MDETLVDLADRALALLDDELPDAPVEAIGRVDLVAQQALVQARNTLRGAWLLLFDGFEVQALALARLITEYVVVAWSVRSGVADPELWLQTESRPPSAGELLATLEREGPELPELAGYVTEGREILHRLAHQDWIAFSFAYRLDEGRPSFFRRAGAVDATSLRRGGEFLLPLSLLVAQPAGPGHGDEPTDVSTRPLRAGRRSVVGAGSLASGSGRALRKRMRRKEER